MREWLKINGTHSNSVTGLLIQELPPISRAPKRVNTVEIDGRDGAIIEFLGYGTYEKTVKIGLYGDFDVNEVIGFFDDTHELVFSNEPDKKYECVQVAEIDLVKLLRLKEGEVTFTVQPFKTPTDSDLYEFTGTCTLENIGNMTATPTYVLTLDAATAQTTIQVRDSKGVRNVRFNNSDWETGSKLVLDTNNLNASIGNSFVNRSVSGSLKDLRVASGQFIVTITGGTSSCTIENYTRWL